MKLFDTWEILLTIILGISVSTIFIFGSFEFVDKDNAFTEGGLILFVIGIFGYALTAYVSIIGFPK